MTNSLRPLCLSFWAPPVVRPQAVLLGKMIPEWIRQKVQPIIVTLESNGRWDIDAVLYTIPAFRMIKYLNRFSPLRDLLLERYYRSVTRRLVDIIRDHDCNILYSFANPQASNIIGAMVKEQCGIKFLSHFSDPWYDSPFRALTGLAAEKVLQKETYIVRTSDRVVFIDEAMKEFIMRKFRKIDQRKSRVIHHCFNPADYPTRSRTDDSFVISHVGIFHKERTPETFFQAVRFMLDRDSRLVNKLKINLIGSINSYSNYSEEDLKKLVDAYHLSTIVNLIPPVSYRESLQYMKNSDLLLAIDAHFSSTPWILSKVIDYAGSGVSIVSITASENPTAAFVKQYGGRTFFYSEVTKLGQYLFDRITRDEKPRISTSFLEQYHVSVTTARLMNLFKEVLDE